MKHAFKKADIVLFASAAAFALLFFAVFFMQKGAIAHVFVDGQEEFTFDLSRTAEAEIIELEHNKIEVGSGYIRFIEADCPDKKCIAFGKLTRPGQSAACVPEKIVITVTAKNEKNAPDGVTGE